MYLSCIDPSYILIYLFTLNCFILSSWNKCSLYLRTSVLISLSNSFCLF
jgi:hypothetical protein